MQEKPVDPDEIIERLDKLIEFFEKHEFVLKNHDEKERPDTLDDRKRRVRKPEKSSE